MCRPYSESVLFKMAQAALQQANYQIDETSLSEDQLKKEPQEEIRITCQHCKWSIEMFVDSIYYNMFNTAKFTCLLCTHGLQEFIIPEETMRTVAEHFYILQHMAYSFQNFCGSQCSSCRQHPDLCICFR